MLQTTIDQLNELNRQFYETVGESFDATRQQPWEGWQQLVPDLTTTEQLTVLDLGCGNGRWGIFLVDQLPNSAINYTGVDENAFLLQQAARSLLSRVKVLELHHATMQSYLEKQLDQTNLSHFDNIVLFGVWHHVAGSEQRTELLRDLAQLLTPDGKLMISCWRFLRNKTLAKRQIDPSTCGIDPTTLEEGDYLLDWQRGKRALRYCHDTSLSQMQNHANSAHLTISTHFSADGKTGDLNDYYVLIK